MSIDLVDVLNDPVRRHGKLRVKGVLRLKRMIPVRGLSCRVGEPLAAALSDRAEHDWASTMLASIQCRRETASTRDVSGLLSLGILSAIST